MSDSQRTIDAMAVFKRNKVIFTIAVSLVTLIAEVVRAKAAVKGD